jgi:hypothetical protein
MIEAGGDPDLLQESFGAEHCGDLGTHHLERDQAVVLQVPGEIDHGHPACAELTLQGVAIVKCLAERRYHVQQECHPVDDLRNLVGSDPSGQQ